MFWLEILAQIGIDVKPFIVPSQTRQLIERDQDEILRRRPDLAPVVADLLHKAPRAP